MERRDEVLTEMTKWKPEREEGMSYANSWGWSSPGETHLRAKSREEGR